MTLRALVLGAAAGGGLPQWNCAADNSERCWRGAADAAFATQSSLAVSADGKRWALLNASPDLRSQIVARPELHPRLGARHGLRNSPIHSVLLTNGDIDHVAGLLTLREKQALTLFATREVSSFLTDNPIFNALDPKFVSRRTVALEEPFALAPGVEARLFAVPGKVPLYLEAGEVDTALVGEQTVGVGLGAPGEPSRAFYIPGCAAAPPALLERLEGAAALFFDGTLWEDDEMIAAKVGVKTGRRMGHMPISGPGGTLESFRDLALGRKILVHLNNTNPLWRAEAPERAIAAGAGWEVAYDGMEVRL